MNPRIVGNGIIRPPGFAQVVNSLSPTYWWRLGESSGPTAVDEISAANGTYGSGVTLGQTGALWADTNTAILNDGTDEVAVTTASPVTDNAWSAVLWFKVSTQTQQLLSQKDGAGTGRSLATVRVTSGNLACFFGGTVIEVPVDTADNFWHMASITFSGGAGGTLTAYLDSGANFVSATRTGEGATGALVIGGDKNELNSLSGSLDEVVWFSSALTSTQVARLYAAGTNTPWPIV